MMKYAVLLLLFLLPLVSATNVTSCQPIVSSGTYDLINNLNDTFNPPPSFCLDVQANNVIINCHGFSITDTTGGPSQGISGTGFSNLTIKNCLVQNYTENIQMTRMSVLNITNNSINLASAAFGVQIIGSNISSIYNNTFFLDNTAIALLDSSNFINITNNTFLNSTGTVISISNSSNNIVTNNSANVSGFAGISVESEAMNNTLTNNILVSSVEDGIDVSSNSNNNTISDNIITNSGIGGISNQEASNNLFHNNSIINNNFIGIFIGGISQNLTVSDNNISTIFYGILISGPGSNNTVTSNNIQNASVYGAIFANPSQSDYLYNNTILNCLTGIAVQGSSNNILSNNTVTNTTSGIYILANSENNTINQNNVSISSIGVNISESVNTSLSRNNIFSNQIDLSIESSNITSLVSNHYYNSNFQFQVIAANIINTTTEIFDSNGLYQNFTNISFNSSSSTGLTFNWSNINSFPSGYTSFANKTINITTNEAIDTVMWHWLTSDLNGNSYLGVNLFLNNGSWNSKNTTPNPNDIALSNLNGNGLYSLLSIIRNLYFDSPTPANQSTVHSNPITINITTSFSLFPPCYIEVDGINQSGTIAGASCSYSFNSTQQIHNYTIKGFANVSGNIIQTNESRNFTFNAAYPQITLNSPNNSITLTGSPVTFNYTVLDSFSTSLNCTLYLNGNNISTVSTTNNTQNILSIPLINNNYNWSVTCNNSVNTNSSELRFFTLTVPIGTGTPTPPPSPPSNITTNETIPPTPPNEQVSFEAQIRTLINKILENWLWILAALVLYYLWKKRKRVFKW